MSNVDDYAPRRESLEECGCIILWTPGYLPSLDQHRVAYCPVHAAAPDLLEACEAAMQYDQSIMGRAARGEVDLLESGAGVAEGDDLDTLYLDWMTKAWAAVAKARA